jgi:periplasmic divalent cation tolerance protein
MMDHLQVFCTTDSREEADVISETLVREGLAACAQITGPITSVYRWKGSVEHAEEWLMMIKTTSEAYEALEAAIIEHHSYETPEVVAVRIEHGSEAYLDWLRAAVRGR